MNYNAHRSYNVSCANSLITRERSYKKNIISIIK